MGCIMMRRVTLVRWSLLGRDRSSSNSRRLSKTSYKAEHVALRDNASQVWSREFLLGQGFIGCCHDDPSRQQKHNQHLEAPFSEKEFLKDAKLSSKAKKARRPRNWLTQFEHGWSRILRVLPHQKLHRISSAVSQQRGRGHAARQQDCQISMQFTSSQTLGHLCQMVYVWVDSSSVRN